MKLPNAADTIVAKEKITAYLLSPTHPQGGGKANFFSALGFHPNTGKCLRLLYKTMR